MLQKARDHMEGKIESDDSFENQPYKGANLTWYGILLHKWKSIAIVN